MNRWLMIITRPFILLLEQELINKLVKASNERWQAFIKKMKDKLGAAVAWSKRWLIPGDDSLASYLQVGPYYIAKRLITYSILLIALIIYLVYFQTPAWLSSWLNRVQVVQFASKEIQSINGKVKMMNAEQVVYEGEVAEGKLHGQGKLYNQFGRLIYDGQFEKGVKKGTGKAYTDQGLIWYDGMWDADLPNGKGQAINVSGNVYYRGDFSNGKITGEGESFHSDRTLRYRGTFLNGQFEGIGMAFAPSGKKIYEGNWKSGLYDGTGTLFDTNGNTSYQGPFLLGQASGNGIDFYTNGTKKYEGTFLKGQYDGQGTLYREDGSIQYQGAFQQSLAHGEGALFDELKNEVYLGFFANGEIAYENWVGMPEKKVQALYGKPPLVRDSFGLDQSLTKLMQASIVVTPTISPKNRPIMTPLNETVGSPSITMAEAEISEPVPTATIAPTDTPMPLVIDTNEALYFTDVYPERQMAFSIMTSKTLDPTVMELEIWGNKAVQLHDQLQSPASNAALIEENEFVRIYQKGPAYYAVLLTTEGTLNSIVVRHDKYILKTTK